MLSTTNDLEDKFKALEGGGVDDELAAMKAKMLGEPAQEGWRAPGGRGP